jgi:hypothetical protein
MHGLTNFKYPDTLQLWLMPQLQKIPTFIFQQNQSPAHFHCEALQYLNTVLPGRWIGRAFGNDQPLTLWPPRSPDITPCDFFLWGYVKDGVFVPPLPRDLDDLKARIIAAVKNIDAPMLTCVCVCVCGKNLNIVSMCSVSPVVHTSNISSC